MSTAPRISKEKFSAAIKTYRGIKSDIARHLSCSRQTVDNYLVRWPELEAELLEERDKIVDLAESKLISAIEDGEVKAIIFALETLGKRRGYVKRTETTGVDGAPVETVIRIVREAGFEQPPVPLDESLPDDRDR